jgi:hypothetical protein
MGLRLSRDEALTALSPPVARVSWPPRGPEVLIDEARKV